MPTLSIVTKNNQFIFQSTVSMPTSFTKRKVYGALFDTGAQISMISPKIVSEVQLKTIGDAFVTPVNGEVIQTPRYSRAILKLSRSEVSCIGVLPDWRPTFFSGVFCVF